MENATKHPINVADTNKAAESLLIAFNWAESPEGFDYWAEVFTKLSEIARKAQAEYAAEVAA